MTEKSGEWYLPNSKSRIPGKLYIDKEEKRIILHLFTSIFLNGNNIEIDKIHKENSYEQLILGEGQGSNSFVTLYSCAIIYCSAIKEGFYELKYQVEFVFDNINVDNINNLLFKKVSVTFPNIRNFYDGWESMTEDFEPEEQYHKNHIEVKINENFKIVFSDIKQKIDSFRKDYQIKYSKNVSFEYSESVNLNQINKDCYTFKRMLEFSNRKNLEFKINNAFIELKSVAKTNERIYCLSNEKDKEPSLVNTFISSRLDFNKEIFLDKKKMHQNSMLFSGWSESKDELNQIIEKWFSNDSLMPIYDFYIDSHNWFNGRVVLSNVMYNNKFLNLIQGLEAYYDFLDPSYTYTNEEFTKTRQQVLNQITDEKLKIWVTEKLKFPQNAKLGEKLSFLCDKYEKILTDIFEQSISLDSYPSGAKEYRHKLSHGRIDETYQGTKLDLYYKFSQILLCICILDSLEMKHDKISKRIKINSDLNRLVWAIENNPF